MGCLNIDLTWFNQIDSGDFSPTLQGSGGRSAGARARRGCARTVEAPSDTVSILMCKQSDIWDRKTRFVDGFRFKMFQRDDVSMNQLIPQSFGITNIKDHHSDFFAPTSRKLRVTTRWPGVRRRPNPQWNKAPNGSCGSRRSSKTKATSFTERSGNLEIGRNLNRWTSKAWKDLKGSSWTLGNFGELTWIVGLKIEV